MCLFVAELIMLAGGIYALIAGKVKLTQRLSLEGRQARVAGLFLAVPFPLSLLAGFVLGLAMGVDGFEAAQSYAAVTEIVLVLLGLLGAVVFAWVVKSREPAAIGEGDTTPHLTE
jgi:hypothetical protein